MRTLHVVTHPEATHHVAGLVGGWFDSDLTPRGLDQAAKIADVLATRAAGAEVYSSDLLRTRRTAEVVANRLGTGVTLDGDLREKSYGEAGGRPQSWLDARFVPPPRDGERMRHDEGIPGAETKHDLAVRVYAALDRIVKPEAAHQVIVTHGMAATFVLAAWIGMPLEAAGRVAFRFTAGGITTLHEDDYFHNHAVVSLNDVSHL
ncbi:putative phosphoglycerate mutase [Paractinoplanes abujensis]|uniref:Putative phosphoglycerate mutase n=1 Tax=Paractinoplanes abujensis TaxID=882441 RepID=A0A7W7G4D3_9ACTN|nr:histidine phosphatase family protein [Actinoplanes abujensis]MBB4695155.1 putative phosphoglycerate mutase [Actinoplanes abujensis]GID23889.1 putative phosphoglycerate mutase [Actinoplanes abujensis]